MLSVFTVTAIFPIEGKKKSKRTTHTALLELLFLASKNKVKPSAR